MARATFRFCSPSPTASLVFHEESISILSNLPQISLRRSIFFAAMVVVFATYLNGLKLRQTDLWDHVNYGRTIVATNALPKTEPLLPLASDDALINPAWGSQVLMAQCVDSAWLGLAGIQTAHGMLVLLCISLIGLAVLRKTGSGVFAILASILYLYVNWQQFLVIRPQTIGLVFYTGLFVLLSQNLDRYRAGKVCIVLTFIVWANLHGSFMMGLFLIGMMGIGRLLSLMIRTHQRSQVIQATATTAIADSKWGFFAKLLHKSGFTRLLFLGLGCAAAVLINPYGIYVYEEVFRVGGHPNMQSMLEWRPLSLSMKQGRAAGFACVLLLVFAMVARRRWQMQSVILFLLLGILMLWSSRMINWWAPVASYLAGIQAASAFRKFIPRTPNPPTTTDLRRSPLLEGVVLFAASLVIFCISPIGLQTFGHKLPMQQLLESRTPIKLARYLADPSQHPQPGPADLLQGTIFCPAEWTGYLTSATRQTNVARPAAVKTMFPFRPLVSTHVHVIPTEVWHNFLTIHQGHPQSLAILDHYDINTVVIDLSRQKSLVERLTNSGQFQKIYEDSKSHVWHR